MSEEFTPWDDAIDQIDRVLDRAAECVNAGTLNFTDVFESFRKFEAKIGMACPTCGSADHDAGIWDDAGIPEAICQDLFHGVNRQGQDLE